MSKNFINQSSWQTGIGKQCTPRSDCSFSSSLIRGYAIFHSTTYCKKQLHKIGKNIWNKMFKTSRHFAILGMNPSSARTDCLDTLKHYTMWFCVCWSNVSVKNISAKLRPCLWIWRSSMIRVYTVAIPPIFFKKPLLKKTKIRQKKLQNKVLENLPYQHLCPRCTKQTTNLF